MRHGYRIQLHIFEPFLPLKKQALDWGWQPCTESQAKGGYIRSKSETGKGTTFRIYLPRVSQAGRNKLINRAHRERVSPGIELFCLSKMNGPSEVDSQTLLDAGLRFWRRRTLWRRSNRQTNRTHIDLLLTTCYARHEWRLWAEALSSHRPDMRVILLSGYSDGVIARHGVVEAGIQSFVNPSQGDH